MGQSYILCHYVEKDIDIFIKVLNHEKVLEGMEPHNVLYKKAWLLRVIQLSLHS